MTTPVTAAKWKPSLKSAKQNTDGSAAISVLFTDLVSGRTFSLDATLAANLLTVFSHGIGLVAWSDA